MGETAKCIYCLKEKPVEDFNREHVISRMLGRYSNVPTLNNHEVCHECNSYFCDEIENILASDSLEGLLRSSFHHAKDKDTGRIIGKTRLNVTGKNGIFNGLKFTPSLNGNNPEGSQYLAEPAIGIQSSSDDNKFDYYTLESFPTASELSQKGEPRKGRRLVVSGYCQEDVEKALIEKGYNLAQAIYTDNLSFFDIAKEPRVEVNIEAKVDPLVLRLALKNIINYICYTMGKEYILKPSINNIRSYARYGTINDILRAQIFMGSLSTPENVAPNSHIIGMGITALQDGFYLVGFATWFGCITYAFILEKADVLTMRPEKWQYIICNNAKREIDVLNNFAVIDWPQSGRHIKITDEGNLMIVPVE